MRTFNAFLILLIVAATLLPAGCGGAGSGSSSSSKPMLTTEDVPADDPTRATRDTVPQEVPPAAGYPAGEDEGGSERQ